MAPRVAAARRSHLDDEGDDPEQEVETWRVSQRLHRFSDRLADEQRRRR